VVAITKRAPTEHARIEVGAETMVTASTTNEAVEAFAFEGGKPPSTVI
jgi:molybdopterin-binding protein